MKLSVLMASYNHAQWVGEAIESVLSQSVGDFEFIIVDDGSQDHSVEVIQAYAKQDKRIQFDPLPHNVGAVTAVRRAYERAQGEMIAKISSDDVWLPGKLEKQFTVFENKPDLGAVFGMPMFIDAQGRPLISDKNEFAASCQNRSRYAWLNHFFHQGNCLCHPTILIRKACYERCGFYDPRFRSMPDFDMWVRLCFEYDIHVMDECLIKFRKHQYNESGAHQANLARFETELKQILQQFFEKIKSIKLLTQIFPECAHLVRVEEDALTPFYLAQYLLQGHAQCVKALALERLYELMQDTAIVTLLTREDLYSYVKLHEDVTCANWVNKPATPLTLLKQLHCQLARLKVAVLSLRRHSHKAKVSPR